MTTPDDTDIDEVAQKAKKRVEDAAKKATEELQTVSAKLIEALNLKIARESAKPPVDPLGYSTNNIKLNGKNNLSYRIRQIELEQRDIYNKFNSMSERMAIRESAISPEMIAKAVEQINANKKDIEEMKAAEKELSKVTAKGVADYNKTCAMVNDRMDAIQLKSQEYYSVVAPREIKDAIELLHQLEISFEGVKEEFHVFKTDRIARLEHTDEAIDKLEGRIKDNQLSQQKWINGIIIMIIGLTMGVILALIGL